MTLSYGQSTPYKRAWAIARMKLGICTRCSGLLGNSRSKWCCRSCLRRCAAYRMAYKARKAQK